MRDLAQIDKDIAEVQARIARRNEGMPLKSEPAYRAARFDYIVEGDRSGLDNYQNSLNAAIQNKLSRESQEKLLKEGKERANEEDEITWRKDMTNARSDLADVRRRIAQGDKGTTQKDLEDAVANFNFHAQRGAKKNYKDVPALENVVQKTEQQNIDGSPFDMRQFVRTVAGKESATIDELKQTLPIIEYLKAQKADMSNEEATIADRISKIEGPQAMDTSLKSLQDALAGGDPDAIDAAADDYDKHKSVQGYEGKHSTEARKKAGGIRADRSARRSLYNDLNRLAKNKPQRFAKLRSKLMQGDNKSSNEMHDLNGSSKPYKARVADNGDFYIKVPGYKEIKIPSADFENGGAKKEEAPAQKTSPVAATLTGGSTEGFKYARRPE